jgi:HD-like signal output (HDOD) protein
MSKASKASLDHWIKQIQEREMPIFGRTVQSIASVSKNSKASISQLAKVILQDSSMTTKVLRLANSTFYRPIYNRINTVTRAVMVLGFETIGNISISVALVDSLLTGKSKDRVTQELARAIHAAVQARSLASQLEDPDPEEVFVATLLYNIGDIAFWCFAKNEGQQLSALMSLPGYSPEQAQRELLGFQLKALSLGLVKQWGINQLLVDTLEHPGSTGSRGQIIELSRQLASMSEVHGWDSQEVQSLLEQASKLTRIKPESLIEQLHQNARQAAETAAVFGAAAAAVAIPMPNKEKPLTEVTPIEVRNQTPCCNCVSCASFPSRWTRNPISTSFWKWSWKASIAASALTAPSLPSHRPTAKPFLPNLPWARAARP